MAVLRLAKMEFTGYHGVTDEEKKQGGKFEVDCEIEADIAKAAAGDTLNDTFDYDLVYSIIQEHIENRKYNLLESLAEKMKSEIKEKTGATTVRLRVRKMGPAVSRHSGYFEVETSD